MLYILKGFHKKAGASFSEDETLLNQDYTAIIGIEGDTKNFSKMQKVTVPIPVEKTIAEQNEFAEQYLITWINQNYNEEA